MITANIIWNIFCFCCSLNCFYIARYCVKQVTSKHASVFNRSAKRLNVQASPRASTFVKNIFANTCCMCATTLAQHYPTTFAQLQCLLLRSSIWSEEHSPCLFQATAPTQLHQRFVILSRLHSCSSTGKTWCERSKRTSIMVRISIEIWGSYCDLCNIVYMQKAAAQQDAWAQRSVWRCQCAACNTVSEFSPFCTNFFS